jgi:hypothetical protein
MINPDLACEEIREPEKEVSKEEAVEVTNLKCRKPVLKEITISI